MVTPVQNHPIMHCKPFGIEYVMYAYGLHLFYLNLLLLIMKNVDSVQMTITNTVLLPNLHCHLRGKNLLENAENGISERLDFKISWGACPQTPLRGLHLRCSFSQPPTSFPQPATSKLTESTDVCFSEVLENVTAGTRTGVVSTTFASSSKLSQDSVIICCMIACSYGTIMV